MYVFAFLTHTAFDSYLICMVCTMVSILFLFLSPIFHFLGWFPMYVRWWLQSSVLYVTLFCLFISVSACTLWVKPWACPCWNIWINNIYILIYSANEYIIRPTACKGRATPCSAGMDDVCNIVIAAPTIMLMDDGHAVWPSPDCPLFWVLNSGSTVCVINQLHHVHERSWGCGCWWMLRIVSIGGAELWKGCWLQLNELHPWCIAGPKYLRRRGTAEQYRRDLVEWSESMSEVWKLEVRGQRDRGLGFRNVRRGLRQEKNWSELPTLRTGVSRMIWHIIVDIRTAEMEHTWGVYILRGNAMCNAE
jgi:hypothetical protein